MTRVRRWVWTLNNYTEEELSELAANDDAGRIRYLTWGQEIGQNGTPHLQGCVFLNAAMTINSVKRLPGFQRMHLEPMRGTDQQAIDYCHKDNNNIVEIGDRPDPAGNGRAAEQARWELARQNAKTGDWDNIPADILLRCSSGLKWVQQLYLEGRNLPTLDGQLNNDWFWGQAGTGKSLKARQDNPGAYLKTKNKWWNGYTTQETVIVDDIDPTHEKWIGPFLKEWADRYPFQAEIKGSCMVIRPNKIVVTSQYSIEQCFQDPETVAALRRHFKVTHFN